MAKSAREPISEGAERQEGAQLVQEWRDLKDSINKTTGRLLHLEEEHSERKRIFDTILESINGRLAPQKAALDAAKKRLEEADAKRKDAYHQLRVTPQDSKRYNQVKVEYHAALAAKTQAEKGRQEAQVAYDKALKPFEERLSASRKAKDKAYGLLKAVQEELAEAESKFQELSRDCFEHTNARELFDQEMVDLVETSVDVRKKINLLTPVRDWAAEILRGFASQNPTGWSTGAIETAESYLTWISCGKTHGVILEDNPTYRYEFSDVRRILGKKRTFEFVVVEIDKSKLEKAAEAGTLRRKGNGVITLEQLQEIRQTKLGTPRMKGFRLGELAVDEVMSAMAQELYERDVRVLEELEESGKLPKQTVSALSKAGISKVAQLQRLSLQQLAMVPGIGEKRAVQIFRVLLGR